MFDGGLLFFLIKSTANGAKRKNLQRGINTVRSNNRGDIEMEATKEEMREVVYANLYQLYSRYAMECFPIITPELSNIISVSAYQELIQMMQGGYLKDYYERIKNNAV